MWKWIVAVLAVFVLLCAGGGTWLASSGALKFSGPGMGGVDEVRTTTATRGSLTRSISAPGEIEPRRKVEISAQVAARIIELPFKEGASVHAGETLVKLDADDLKALVDSARASLAAEQARLEGSQAAFQAAILDLGRKRELFSTHDIPKAELDISETEHARAESALRAAQFAVDIAHANVARAEKDLSNTTIASPIDGTIIQLNAEVGELVLVGTLNNPASVIMTVADLSDMILRARIDETNVAPVRPDQKAIVRVNAFLDNTIPATVERLKLFRQIDRDGSAYFEAELKLHTDALADSPKTKDLVLRSGLTANAEIEVETFDDTILVPSQCVLDRAVDDLPDRVKKDSPYIDATRKYARVVYELVDGKAKARPVKIGASDLTRTIILGGLDENATIISGPFKVLQKLKDDMPVTLEGDKSKKKGLNFSFGS